MTTGRRARGGGPLPLPFELSNAAPISGQSIPRGLALHLATTASSHAVPNAAGATASGNALYRLAWAERGAIAGALKKRLGLGVAAERVEGRGRVYRLA